MFSPFTEILLSFTYFLFYSNELGFTFGHEFKIKIMNSEENYHNELKEKGSIRIEARSKNKSKKRSILGLIFITVGAVLIAKKMDLIPADVSRIIISWQMLLIGIGAFNILTNKNYSSGLILISIGTFFILPKMFDIPFEVKEMFWPAIFVIIGVLMITVRNRHKGFSKTESSEHQIDMLTIMGGGNRKISSDKFMGGKVTSLFGGSEIDLTGAKLNQKECVIDVFTMFGGAEIAVPRNWEVQVDVTSVFGGFDDKRGPVEKDNNDNETSVLVIKGFTIFGGGEVKSY
jgi:predicted membrane protein